MGDSVFSKWIGRERGWNCGDQPGAVLLICLLYLTVLCEIIFQGRLQFGIHALVVAFLYDVSGASSL